MQILVDSVLIGRILAGVVIFLAIVYAIVGAVDAPVRELRYFPGQAGNSVGCGFPDIRGDGSPGASG